MEEEYKLVEVKWVTGDRVKAIKQITESGKLPGNPNAKSLDPDWIHAEAGELGTVVHDLADLPTIRFDRTRTATIVRDDEIKLTERDY